MVIYDYHNHKLLGYSNKKNKTNQLIVHDYDYTEEAEFDVTYLLQPLSCE